MNEMRPVTEIAKDLLGTDALTPSNEFADHYIVSPENVDYLVETVLRLSRRTDLLTALFGPENRDPSKWPSSGAAS